MLRELLVIALVVRHETQNTSVHTVVGRFIGVLTPAQFVFLKPELALAYQGRSYDRFSHASCATFTCDYRPNKRPSRHTRNEHSRVDIRWHLQALVDEFDCAV